MPRRPQDPALLRSFGARVRALREERGITQQRLSELLGVRASTVSQIETGDLSPTLTTIAAIARALKTRVPDLLDFEAPAAPTPDADERDLLAHFRSLPPAHRQVVLGVARGLSDR